MSSGSQIAADVGFDPDELGRRYQAERAKRLRSDGSAQYRELAGQFADLARDPYVEPGFSREPITASTEVLVLGGGFGGLLAAVRLRQAGFEDISIIEKAGDFGGTWYWNRYPGAACDMDATVYMPLLEETGYMPKNKYADGPEILEHHRRIARHFDLYRGAIFQTELTSMRWNEAEARWMVHTSRDDKISVRFVVMASGPMHKPKLPGIPGIEDFRGKMFHTTRWDYRYTGGDGHGGLDRLADRRVGVIGTGASAIQVVPHLAAAARHLYVFQRTPSTVDVRGNRPNDPDWIASLKPGWQQERMDNFNTLTSGGAAETDLVGDGWTDIIRNLILMAGASSEALSPERLLELRQLADYAKMEQIRGRVDATVRDRATAASLKPYYNYWCKRPCFHDEYLETFNRPNVTLVDTDGCGVERITAGAAFVSGRQYELDCLIFATGFDVSTSFTHRSGLEVYGAREMTLSDYWRQGVRTLHGMHAHGFPNLSVMAIPQAALSVAYPYMLNEQAKHVAYVLSEVRRRGAVRFEVTEKAESRWVETIRSMSGPLLAFWESCTPGYYNNEGKPDPFVRQNAPYGAGSLEFLKILARWREEGSLAGIELSHSLAMVESV